METARNGSEPDEEALGEAGRLRVGQLVVAIGRTIAALVWRDGRPLTLTVHPAELTAA